jgi:alpha-methylacyl-CoA racemase
VNQEQGPLAGLKVIELASIGPGPFGAMMLADMGAEVIRVDRVGGHPDGWGRSPVLDRNRTRLEIDLKSAEGVAAVLDLVADADAILEGMRPGVAERLGVGPADCLARNPALVYGRMTGWGQSGPYAGTAGHDINFLAVSGALHGIGRAGGPPIPPINLLGDFGGGGLMLAFGVVCAIHAARADGRGRVVDAAIVDGAAALTGMIHGFLAEGEWTDDRGVNLLDGGAPFYDTYACADGGYVAVGALESQFFRALVAHLGLEGDPDLEGDHLDRANWPAIRSRLTEVFAGRDRDEWARLFADSDCCVSPVLSLREAIGDAHMASRAAFAEVDGVMQPAPAPRFL